jgi:NADH-quinone oxidoreductase subunit E
VPRSNAESKSPAPPQAERVAAAAADEVLDAYPKTPSSLIGVLQDLQARLLYLPREALQRVSETLDVPLSQVYSVATFYTAFTLKPRGKHLLSICLGTACHVRGAPRLMDEVLSLLQVEPNETTEDGVFTLQCVNCLGACALGPVAVLDGEYQHHMTPPKLRKLIQSVREAEGEVPAHA